VKGKAHCAISVVPTLAQRTRKNGAPPALVAQAGKASATRPHRQKAPLSRAGLLIQAHQLNEGGPAFRWHRRTVGAPSKLFGRGVCASATRTRTWGSRL